MVYCKLKEYNDSTVTYKYGDTMDDMTGELCFHFKDDEIEIIKDPERYPVRYWQINSLYGIHRIEFKQGKFKEKIAWE